MKLRLQQALIDRPLVRRTLAAVALLRSRLHRGPASVYRRVRDLCWAVRLSKTGALRRAAERRLFQIIADLRIQTPNALVTSYHADPASEACADIFSLSGGGSADLMRDLIVLKRARTDEKGVILLKYARTFSATMALLDMRRLMEKYIFVLEPCWAGYCDPSLLMFIARGRPVFVQCFTEEDYSFVSQVGSPLVPIRLGPADWVDADLFRPAESGDKAYDLVMVANWGRHKRHAQLFRALATIQNRDVQVLLIGFPWAGRTAEDVRREAAVVVNKRISIEIVEKLSPPEVARRVSQCKVLVFLSRKEGDNKALMESMFLNVPAIVYEGTIGGARARINQATGIFASDEELSSKLEYMLDHYQDFKPADWARAHSGSAIATHILDDAIREVLLANGERYTESIVEKTNSPNLAYKDPQCRQRFQHDYDFILTCRRGQPIVPREAA